MQWLRGHPLKNLKTSVNSSKMSQTDEIQLALALALNSHSRANSEKRLWNDICEKDEAAQKRIAAQINSFPTNSHRWPYGATAKCWSSVQWESWGGIAVLLCHVKHETWNAPLRFKGWKIKIISFTLAWDERKGHWHCDCYANVFLQLGPLDHLRQHLAVGLKPAASSVSRSVNFTAKWSEFVVWWAPWSNSACWGCQKWSLSNPAKLTPKMEVFRLDFHST